MARATTQTSASECCIFCAPFMHSPAVQRQNNACRHAGLNTSKAMKGELDQKRGIKDLQIRRGWLDQIHTVPAFQRLDRADRQVYLKHSDCCQVDVEIDRLLMVKGNLFAFAA